MSLSTTLTFNTLPATVQRPPLHDGRSHADEVVKLVNQMRGTLNGDSHTAFDFTTPGDNTFHNAWGAQLQDGEAWLVVTQVVATSAKGDVAGWLRRSSISRSGALVSILSDVSVSFDASVNLVNFDVKWAVSSLYAYLQLRDDTAVPGTWRSSISILSTQAP